MPLHLIHGPAGIHKTDHILGLAEEKSHTHSDESLFIIPSSHLQDWYHQKWLKLTNKSGFFYSPRFISFEEFLLQLVKQNHHEVHRSDPLFTRLLLRKLFQQKNYPQLKTFSQYSGYLNQISQTFIELKKNSLGPNEAKKFFSSQQNYSLTQDLLELFSDYESRLQELNYWDNGSLYYSALQDLKNKKLEIPKKIYLDRLFPLSLGQREILQEIVHRYPEVDITVSYSFDYQTQDDPYFYPGFNFLGELSSHQTFLERKQENSEIKTYALAHPRAEINWCLQHIQEALQTGIHPEEILILIPSDDYYHQTLSFELSQKGIASQPSPALKKTPSFYLKAPFFEEENRYLSQQYLQKAQEEELRQQWEFNLNLIFGSYLPENRLVHRWWEEEKSLLNIRARDESRGVKILSLNEAHHHDSKILIILGATQNNFPSPLPESPFYSSELMQKLETQEILFSPAYQTLLQKHQWQTCLKRNQQKVSISYPQISWQGQAQSISPWIDTENLKFHLSEATRVESSTTKTFPSRKTKVFSISALDTYNKCPFRYYLKYQLKTPPLFEEKIDLPPDLKGNLVHRFLEGFYQKYDDLYRSFLESSDKDNDEEFFKTLEAFIDRESQKEKYLSQFAALMKNSFLDKVKKTLRELFILERQAILDGSKQTYPQLFEWAFGRGSTPPLKLEENGEEVLVSGRIDRIDINQDAGIFSVIDYKTGEPDSAASLKRGDSLQIPLYLMAVQKYLFPDYRPASGTLLSLKDLSKKTGLSIKGYPEEEFLNRVCQLSEDDWDELENLISSKIIGLKKSIEAGKFEPQPLSDSECRYCDYRQVCDYAKK